ncbi:1-acyl-sn-glycerol-3-phosphate acyltransferase domain protein, partial [Vibrio parahaemolyticus V-223/04]
RC